MSEERKKVLEMLSEGKITSDEAERLLDKLESRRSGPVSGGATATESPRASAPKYLRVVVDGTDGERVNIRVPLALVRTGIKLSTMLPVQVTEKMKERGIDLTPLSELKGDELTKALEELVVDVDSGNGDRARIFCE